VNGTDLIERLRLSACGDCQRAADEIERLRSLVAKDSGNWQDLWESECAARAAAGNRYQEGYIAGVRKTREEWRAEVERLQAALKQVAECIVPDRCIECQEEARAALEQKP
jgi:multidrug resistance efflux pump